MSIAKLYTNDMNEAGLPTGGSAHGHIVDDEGYTGVLWILWQNGPIKEVGENGVQVVDVLEAALQRVEFLNDLFPCVENDETCDYIRRAIVSQNDRTARRTAQGVEGTNERGAGDDEVASRQLDHEEPA